MKILGKSELHEKALCKVDRERVHRTMVIPTHESLTGPYNKYKATIMRLGVNFCDFTEHYAGYALAS